VPLLIFWEIVLLAWFSIAPGYVIASLIEGSDTSFAPKLTLSCALGMGVTVLISVILNALGIREYTALAVSVLGVISIAVYLRSHLQNGIRTNSANEIKYLAWLAAISCAFVVVYCFNGIHFDRDGSFSARGLFAIDVPYLIGNMPSLDLYGKMHDMHQNGLWFPYHDHVYRFISIPHQVSGADYFTLIAYSFPVFGSILAAISIFSVFKLVLGSRASFLATVASLVIASSWGDHILTGALSPSYLAGIIYAAAIILLIHRMHQAESNKLRYGIWVFLGLSLAALIKTKLPLFAIVAGCLGVISLLSLRKHKRTSLLVLSACILSLLFGLKTSGSSPYQPAGDFVIGAPLMGYANQLARVLHVHPATVDPIIQHFDFELEDLLIPLYAIIHLVRMIALDPRLLLFLLALIVSRRSSSKSDRMIKLFGVFSVTLGLLLPVLYSPSWYPLAISFYAPEIAGMIALICALLLLLPRWQQLPSWSRAAAMVFALHGVISTTLHIIDASSAKVYTLSSDEVKATEWLREHTSPRQVIATLRTDLDLTDTLNDESFYLYGALAQRRIMSEGAKYGALLSAVADTDAVKGLHPVESAQVKLTSQRMWLGEFKDSTPWIMQHGYPYAYYLSDVPQPTPPTNWKEVFRSGSAAVFERVR
jgi:hypothetical protein